MKVIRPELADDPEFRARFSREVDVLARVRGARIVRVIEAGADACGPFLVTEYAAGPSLAAHVDRHGQSVVIGCMVWRPGWPRRWR